MKKRPDSPLNFLGLGVVSFSERLVTGKFCLHYMLIHSDGVRGGHSTLEVLMIDQSIGWNCDSNGGEEVQ